MTAALAMAPELDRRPDAPLQLTAPFGTRPDPQALQPTANTTRLVRSQVRGLLSAAPSFHQLSSADQADVEARLTHVAAYAAECLRDIYWQSERLGQTPVLKETRVSHATPPHALAAANDAPPLASAQANDFAPRAASQIGNVTQQTLRAIAFPTFVADLIRGTFDAILQTNLQQMDAFSKMLSNVSKTVDQFMDDNISDSQAHSFLAQTYPRHLQLQNGKAVPRQGAEELPPPNFESELHTSASLDESSIQETLIPAARRRLAETRLQMLSTMVLMGINRIVITAGKIRATMGFHIDTSDSAFERTAEDIDARVAVRGHYDVGIWGVEASASLAYVNSKRAGSDAEINTETDLTGEVELHFKSDYFPVERFAPSAMLKTISGNTAVPEANPPPLLAPPAAGATPLSAPSKAGKRRTKEAPPAMTSVGSPLPEPRLPTAPIAKGALDPAVNKPKLAEKPAEKPAETPTEKPAEKPPDKPAEKVADKPAGKAAQNPAEKADDQPKADSDEGAEDSAEAHALDGLPRPATRSPGELPWTVH